MGRRRWETRGGIPEVVKSVALWMVPFGIVGGRRHGCAFVLYVAAYTVGRAWIESLRIDTANHILGLRLNDWTSLVVFTWAVTYFVISARRHPSRETLTG